MISATDCERRGYLEEITNMLKLVQKNQYFTSFKITLFCNSGNSPKGLRIG